MTAQPERDDEDWDGVIERAAPDWGGMAVGLGFLAAYVGAMVVGIVVMPDTTTRLLVGTLVVSVFCVLTAFIADADGRWAMRSAVLPWMLGIATILTMLLLKPAEGLPSGLPTVTLAPTIAAAVVTTLTLTARLEGRRLAALKFGALNTLVTVVVAYGGARLLDGV